MRLPRSQGADTSRQGGAHGTLVKALQVSSGERKAALLWQENNTFLKKSRTGTPLVCRTFFFFFLLVFKLATDKTVLMLSALPAAASLLGAQRAHRLL